jgi:hypothetical protein
MPDVCSVISYISYPWYLFSGAEKTGVVEICYFYSLLLVPYGTSTLYYLCHMLLLLFITCAICYFYCLLLVPYVTSTLYYLCHMLLLLFITCAICYFYSLLFVPYVTSNLYYLCHIKGKHAFCTWNLSEIFWFPLVQRSSLIALWLQFCILSIIPNTQYLNYRRI